MLDDDAGGHGPQRADALQGGVRVGDVVERERLPLSEAGAGHRGPRRRGIPVAVQGGRLVGVLPVAQLRLPDEPAGEDRREPASLRRLAVRPVHRSEVVGDGRVVARGVGERLHGEREPGLGGESPGTPPHLLDHPGIVVRVRHRGDVGMVLGRRPQHRGPSDVDVLHRLGEAAVRTGNRPFERIQVDGQKVDGLDAVLAHDFVIGAATPEQAAVHERMKGLDAPPHDLGEARQAGDLRDRNPGFLEEARGPPGRNELDPEPVQRARELLDSVLVRDADQRSANFGISHQLSSRGRRDGAVSRHRRPSVHGASAAAERNDAVRPKLLAERAAIDAEDPGRPALVPGRFLHYRLEQGALHLGDHQVVQPIELISLHAGEEVADPAVDELAQTGLPAIPCHRPLPPAAPDWPSPRVRPSDTLSRLLPRRAICNHGGMVPARADTTNPLSGTDACPLDAGDSSMTDAPTD